MFRRLAFLAVGLNVTFVLWGILQVIPVPRKPPNAARKCLAGKDNWMHDWPMSLQSVTYVMGSVLMVGLNDDQKWHMSGNLHSGPILERSGSLWMVQIHVFGSRNLEQF